MKKGKQFKKNINDLVNLSFKNGKMVEPQITRSIKVLKSLNGSEAIQALSEYLKSLKRKEREHTLYIETTIPLSVDQINRAKKIAEGKHKITKVIVSINPEMLGGFKLKVGDQIWDETVLEKINQVKEAILS